MLNFCWEVGLELELFFLRFSAIFPFAWAGIRVRFSPRLTEGFAQCIYLSLLLLEQMFPPFALEI
jgi:hypothetical protein